MRPLHAHLDSPWSPFAQNQKLKVNLSGSAVIPHDSQETGIQGAQEEEDGGLAAPQGVRSGLARLGPLRGRLLGVTKFLNREVKTFP